MFTSLGRCITKRPQLILGVSTWMVTMDSRNRRKKLLMTRDDSDLGVLLNERPRNTRFSEENQKNVITINGT